MDDAISTIEKLIAEHRGIRETIRACEMTVGDIEQAKKLDDVRESLVPGRLEDHRKRAAQLERELMTVDETLKQHFACEEESLLDTFEKQKLPKLASALGKLITEHEHITKQVAELKKEAAQLASDGDSVSLWHERAWRLRKGIFNVRQLIEEHSGKEEAIFQDAKEAIKEQGG